MTTHATPSTLRMEYGLPLFPDLGYGVLVDAGLMALGGVTPNLPVFLATLATAGRLKVIRKLSAIWRATDLELTMASKDDSVMLILEEQAAARPFSECFRDAMDFQEALWASFVPTQDSSGADPTALKSQPTDSQAASLSES